MNTFGMIVESTPENAILIFDRGYNSRDNIDLVRKRRYMGALIQSDHMDLMSLPLDRDSFTETSKTVYGKDHRIIVYHSSSLERRNVTKFMKHFRRVYMKVRSMVESGDSDSMDKARFYLEGEKLNETVLLPALKINSRKMHDRLSMMGKNALFTNIDDMKADELIDLYWKRNRVEHCFRAISMKDLASPVYHWTPQKIKVHMFFSHLAYLFLALMRMKIKPVMDVYLTTTQEIISTIRMVYMKRGKYVERRLFSADERAKRVMEKVDLLQIA